MQTPTLSECQSLCGYLVNKPSNQKHYDLYCKAIESLGVELNPSQSKIWEKMIRSQLYLNLVDSGLSLLDHFNPLRKRIFVMAAILETDPDLSKYFLSRKFSLLNTAGVFFSGLSAGIHSVVGLILLKFFVRGWRE